MYNVKKSHYYFLYEFILLGLVGLIVDLTVINSNTRMALIAEDGPIELPSAIGYFVCLIPLLRHKEANPKSLFCIACVLMILGVRELDFHA